MKLTTRAALAATVVLAVATPATYVHAGKAKVVKTITGSASWYGGKFHGRYTANGERYDMNKLTAAHRSLPFGTKVRVTNRKNGKSIIVRINDRGPFVGGRSIDLSRGAASAVGLISSGVGPVKLDVLN